MSLLVQSEVQGLIELAFKEKGRLRKGNNIQLHCPFCHHRKRKLEVCLDSQEWHCWVCNAKGRTIHGLFRKMRVDENLSGRLQKVLPPSSSPRRTSFDDAAEVVSTPLQLPEEFSSLLDGSKSIAHKMAIRYAKKRNLTTLDIIKYNIGYCDSGEYKDRLIFPSYDSDNHLNFFTARSYYDDVYLKYKNPEADRNIIGYENLVDFRFPITLCEGQLDAIAIKRNVVPLFGKVPSHKLMMILMSELVREIFIVLDDDAISTAINLAENFLAAGKIVHLVNLKGKDPSVLGFCEVTKQIMETPALDFSTLMRLKLKL